MPDAVNKRSGTIGIYSITHVASGKRYIGKSVNVEQRWWSHKNALQKVPMREKTVNRHLWNAVQKHGIDAFHHEVLEAFDEVDEDLLAARELFWMDHYKTCDREYGYNLRRDSSTKMIVHTETRHRMIISCLGAANPNWGNRWSDEQKQRMSESAKARHAEGRYGAEWREKQSAKSTRLWKDPAKKAAMARKVSERKQRYDFLQFDREGRLIRRWSSVQEIVEANPGFKWQNIYSVCHGHKPTYRGFVWRQALKIPDEMLV